MEKKELYRLTERDKVFVGIISTIVLAGFILVFSLTHGGQEDPDAMVIIIALVLGLSLAFFSVWLAISFEIDLHVLRSDLMRIIFVIALLCTVLGVSTLNYALVSGALLSVFLFPFLDWLDISIKIPQNPASALLFSIFQIMVLSLISLLIELLL